jgi:hypothetical protein
MEQYDIAMIPAVLPTRRGPAPTSDRIAVDDALSWIAFGEAKTRPSLDISMVLRWWHPPLELFVALSARVGKPPWTNLTGTVGGEFTPLEKAFYPQIGAERVQVLGGTPIDELFGKQWAMTMRALRARKRQEEGRLISYHELLERLTAALSERQHAIDLLAAAELAFRGQLVAGRISLYARRYQIDRDGVERVGADYEAVTAAIFIGAGIRITALGQVLDDVQGCLFVDAMVRTEELLRLWSAANLRPLTKEAFDEWFNGRNEDREEPPTEEGDKQAAKAEFEGKGIQKLVRDARYKRWGKVPRGPRKGTPRPKPDG